MPKARNSKPTMQLQQRINAFVQLGKFLKQFSTNPAEKDNSVPKNDLFFDEMLQTLKLAESKNAWFTPDNLRFACNSWGEGLTASNIETWLAKYDVPEKKTEKTVAIVMAGNIPLVGFHDFLCVLLTGHSVLAKLSSNDNVLLPFLSKYLIAVAPEFNNKIELTTEKLSDFDAVIATGSDNTAMYFEHYFGTYPNIIRKNRNGVAILSGNESPEQLEELANDIFRYFGLGCRNVSKVFVPENYNWDAFFNGMYSWKEVINNHKYINNYDYNKAVYLMSNVKLLDNEFLLVKQDNRYSSPISVVFYETYSNENELQEKLTVDKDKIQCVVSEKHISFGKAQRPDLSDYADGVDTMKFLLHLYI